MSRCDEILKKIKLSPDEISYIKRHSGDGDPTPELAEKLLKDIERQRFRKLSNQLSEKNTRSFQDRLFDVVKTAKKPYKALFKFLVGDTSGITSKALARAQARFGFFSSQLRMSNSDIKKLLNDKEFVRDFIQEMDRFDGKQKTNNKLAHEVAGVVTDYQKKQRLELNSFGGGVHWRDDYITKQWHDSYRMLAAKQDKWVNDIYTALDHTETIDRIRSTMLDKGMKFNDDTFDLKKFLRSAYDQMTTKSSKQGLLLDNLHLRRTFKFKNTEAFINYNKLYGHDNIAHAIFENMTMMDNHIAYGEAFGFGYRKKIEPDAKTLQKLEDELVLAKQNNDTAEILLAQENYDNAFWKETSPIDEMQKALYLLKDQGKITKRQFRRLRGALAQVSGDAYMTANPTLAKFVTGFQFWEYLTKLGKATLSSVNDLWTGAVILHYQGVKPGRAYLGLINHILKKATKNVSDQERDVLFRQLKVGVDGIFESYSRNYINNPTMGKLNSLTDKMFDLNLLNWWTNSSREGVAKMMSMNFADNLAKGFDDVPPRFRKLLDEYEINADDWNIMRQVGAFDETAFNPNGSKKNKFFTSDHFMDEVSTPNPDKIGDIIIKPEWAKKGLTKKQAQKIEQSINRYYIMESRIAVPEAGAAERAWMYGDNQRGSIAESTARVFFQFRTHQVKMIRNLMPRMYEMGSPSLMHIIPAIGLGYVATSAKAMAAGKEPPAYDDPETVGKALLESGMLAFLADYLGGQLGNYKHDIDEAILGSGYKSLKRWGQLGYELARGNKDAVDFYKHLRHEVPFANLFWAEAAVNYFLHYGIMETMSPGYLYALEARQRGQGTEFIVDPSSLWSYGGLRL